MRPVALSIVKMSWVEPMIGLSFMRQPLSVRYVRGTCTFQPSANFFLIWSGTKKVALDPVKPGIRAGRLREGVVGSGTAIAVF